MQVYLICVQLQSLTLYKDILCNSTKATQLEPWMKYQQQQCQSDM